MSVEQTPGFYRNVERAVYESWAAVRWSNLRHFSRSASHARAEMLNPSPPSAAMETGTAVHTAVLEPASFERLYASAPDDAPERRSKADKAWWAAFEAAAGERTILTADEYKRVLKIRDSVWANPRAAQILQADAGAREASFVWKDEATSLLCKARLDLLSSYQGGALVDLKTTRDASPRLFGTEAARYGYPEQLSFYRDGLDVLSPRDRPAFLIAVETEEPFVSVIYELDGDGLMQARRNVRRYLDEYKRCLDTGVWPGYPEGFLRLPAWYFRDGAE